MSMTTPRVTVPVEFGDETAEQIVRRWASWINDVSADMEEPERGGKTRNDVLNERDFLIRSLSAAPAPEGGAVDREIARMREAARDWRRPALQQVEGPNDLKIYGGTIADDIDRWADMMAALATREEAPAEAGEIGAEYDDAAHCVTLAACPPGLFLWNGTLGFKSEYGAMEPVGISPHHQQWKVGNRVDAYCADSGEYFWGGTSNHDDRAKLLVYPISAEAVAMVASHGLSALRAHPPAREDAQPVASAYRVRPEMNDPEEWTLMHPERAFDYLDRPGWETQPLYTHPAPDALRVALSDAMVEAACSRFVSESDDIWSDSVWPEGPDDDGDRGDGGRVRLISEADQHNIRSAMRFAMTDALAALQAEQGAK